MKMKFNRKPGKKRGPVRAKKVTYDSINFASGLEKFMYICLKEAGIDCEYEGKTFTLVNSFMFNNSSYERQANGKGDYIDRGRKKILPIKYTPDFVADDFIIETKGRANESFPMRWKLFKQQILEDFPKMTLYKPQNQAECKKTVELILSKRNG